MIVYWKLFDHRYFTILKIFSIKYYLNLSFLYISQLFDNFIYFTIFNGIGEILNL